MAMCPGDTTQWEDIHRKLGNFAPVEKEITTNEIEKMVIDAVEQYDPLQNRTVGELHQLEDAVEEDTLAKYRKQRMAELKASRSAARFGSVMPVYKNNFVREVTEASANGQWVLCLLVVEARSACQRLMQPWHEAAKRFPAVKFMYGDVEKVMPGFPDTSTPLVCAYRNGDCEKQIIGIDEWGGSRCNTDCVEWVLAALGAVKTEMEDDPRCAAPSLSWRRDDGRRGQDSEEEESGDERDDRCYSSNQIGRWNIR